MHVLRLANGLRLIFLTRLIVATPEGEDPVDLLQAAARDFIPIDPSCPSSLVNISASQGKPKIVPEPSDRPSIDAILEEIRKQDWYVDQMAFTQTIEARQAQLSEG